MRLIAVILTIAAALPAGALAQTPAPAQTTISGLAVGNTLEAEYPDVAGHPHLSFALKADGSFTAVFPGGVAGSGDYVADARYLCWITKVPLEKTDGANARCETNDAKNHKIGDSWPITDSQGARVVITIRRGQ